MRAIALLSLLSASVLGWVDERCRDGALRQWMVEHCLAVSHRGACKTWMKEQGGQVCVKGGWRRVVKG
jgi:hypothetical protein